MRFNMHSRDRPIVYSTLRKEILDVSVRVGGHRGATGMDLDALRATRGRRSTKDKDDETESETEDLSALRTKGGGTKGGGKMGGKKGGKTGGKVDDRPKCPICKKPRHDSRLLEKPGEQVVQRRRLPRPHAHGSEGIGDGRRRRR